MNDYAIKLEYQYTEAEYLAATRLYLFNSPNILGRMVIVFAFALAAAVIVSVVITDLVPLWTLVAFVVLFEVSIGYNLLIKMPRQYFRGDAKFRDKYEITFSPEGIAVKTAQN